MVKHLKCIFQNIFKCWMPPLQMVPFWISRKSDKMHFNSFCFVRAKVYALTDASVCQYTVGNIIQSIVNNQFKYKFQSRLSFVLFFQGHLSLANGQNVYMDPPRI